MVEEKRRFIRWEKKVRVTYSSGDFSDSFKEIFTENISEVGTQILTDDDFEWGQVVGLKLEFISDSVPIMVECKVVYVKRENNRNRVGLQFIQIDKFEKERLVRCLHIAAKELQEGK